HVRGLRRQAPATTFPRSRDTKRHTPRRPADVRQRARAGAPRRSDTESVRLLSDVALLILAVLRPSSLVPRVLGPSSPVRMIAVNIEFDAQLLHGAKYRVLCRARAETERSTNVVDGVSLVMPERERRAFERTQTFERCVHAPPQVCALRQSIGAG